MIVKTLETKKSAIKPKLNAKAGQEVLRQFRTNEVFVAIVGPAGAGSGTAAKILKSFLEENDFEVEIIKASLIIRAAAVAKGFDVPEESARKSLEGVRMMQDRGDELRRGEIYGLPEDHSAVSRLAFKEIAKRRAQLQGASYVGLNRPGFAGDRLV